MIRYRTVFVLTIVAISLSFIGSLATAGSGSIPLILNGGFEDTSERALSPWNVINGTGDKVVCGTKAPPNTDGGCAFRFKGSTNEATVLEQEADPTTLDAANALLDSTPGEISMNYVVLSDFNVSSLKSKIVVVFTPLGGVKTKVKLTDTFTGSTNSARDLLWVNEGSIDTLAIFEDSTITKVKVLLKNKSPYGKLYVDGIIAVLIGL
ncbi:MAG: hypothetical protein AELANPGJ_03550 [Anaerolineae bacterium]|nr:hypothetical protein [Anaerolineae bacterium]OQY83417.1 MAG: hypothetical protein B6D42_07570 [Anaerolineae bacterium UTCFX5]GIK29689.1 MAG: hypothetical protein BroJett007_28270 [Chloroflexota bacterium]